MLLNALITAWSRRTASDKAGEPAFTAVSLAAAVPVGVGPLSAIQQRALAAAGQTADASVSIRCGAAGTGLAALAAGDRLTIARPGESGDGYEVVKVDALVRQAVATLTAMCRRT